MIDIVYAGSKGFVQAVTGRFSDGVLKIKEQTWFKWPDDEEQLDDYLVKNNSGDVYVTSCMFKTRDRHKSNATTTNVLYVDADKCEPNKFRVAPSIVVETSPGNFQAYWILDDSYSDEEVSQVAHAICIAHKNDGCDQSGWSRAKLMRVPGSTNTKRENHNKVNLREDLGTGEVFTLDDLRNKYADIEVPDETEYDLTDLPDKFPRVIDVAEKIRPYPEIWNLYHYVPTPSDDWSVLRWKLELECFRIGLTPPEVFTVIRASHVDKYARDGRNPVDLWKEILKAQAESEAGIPQPVIPGTEEDNKPVDIKFLTDEERANLPRSFLDIYAEWVHELSPMSLNKYNRTLALQLLSCIYGSWAYVKPTHGPMKLNMWMLILGESTSGKKTTALNIMRSVLHAWEKNTNTTIELASDFTPEGLNVALAGRDGQVSLFHRDEISGFFTETFTKNYMAGSVERLTALYDGEVTVSLRATKGAGNTERSETVFNVVGLGINKHVAEVLTSRHFQSGFLPRFIWCVGEAPTWTPESEFVDEADDDEGEYGLHPQVTEFITHFKRVRKKWDRGKPIRIKFSPEALARFNEWKANTMYVIRGHRNEEIMRPSRERLAYSVWKAAALLAMHDRSDQIELEHLLVILGEAESWFFDMMKMANAVASSEFEAHVNDVETYIGRYKTAVPKAKIYRQFSQYRKGEVDEFILALQVQNRIVIDIGQLVSLNNV